MMTVILVVGLFLSVIIQSTLLNGFRLFNIKPDLFFVVLIFAGLYGRRKHFIPLSFVIGACKDILGIGFFGCHTFLMPLAALAFLRVSQKVSLEHDLICSGFLALLILGYDLLFYLLPFSYTGTISGLVLIKICLLEPVYTALVFFLLNRYLRPYISLIRVPA